MSRLRTFLSRVFGWLGDRKREGELRREISSHIDEAAEEFERQGIPADEARRLAFAQFGGVTQTIEAHRDRRRFRPFASFRQDLVYGARMLARSPGFTLVTVLTLAIGILANTTTVSAVNALLFRPLAIEKPAEVHQIFNGTERDGDDDQFAAKHSYQAYKALREAKTLFEGLLATWTVTKPVNVPASETSSLSYAGRLRGEVVSGNYFTLLGVRALQGRLFTDDDDRTPNAHPLSLSVVVLVGAGLFIRRLRTREIGIRVALGAPATAVRSLVVRQGLTLTAIGLAMGFLGSYLLAPVIDRLLISMPATDLVTFAGTALLLTTTTLMAGYLPARRATRVNPILTLRNE